MAKILEHIIVKQLSIVNCDFSQNAEAAYDVLPKKLLDCCRPYIGDRLRLNPLGKILDCYNDEGVIALSYG
jgi:hypothetical protein